MGFVCRFGMWQVLLGEESRRRVQMFSFLLFYARIPDGGAISIILQRVIVWFGGED
jgi:hypothetical protein